MSKVNLKGLLCGGSGICRCGSVFCVHKSVSRGYLFSIIQYSSMVYWAWNSDCKWICFWWIFREIVGEIRTSSFMCENSKVLLQSVIIPKLVIRFSIFFNLWGWCLMLGEWLLDFLKEGDVAGEEGESDDLFSTELDLFYNSMFL